jgi:hypothetical protein
MRNASVFILLAAWAGTGCVTMPTLWSQPKPEPVLVTNRSAPAAPLKQHRPVTAEQINELNAREKAAQLLQELERETPAGDAKPVESSKPH